MKEITEIGNICHIEIPIPDLTQAIEFYTTVFNWNVNTTLLPNYGLVMDKEVSIGLPETSEFHPQRLGVYIQVHDINQVLKRISEKGGHIESAKNLISENIGFGARFLDPFGNSIGLFADQ